MYLLSCCCCSVLLTWLSPPLMVTSTIQLKEVIIERQQLHYSFYWWLVFYMHRPSLSFKWSWDIWVSWVFNNLLPSALPATHLPFPLPRMKQQCGRSIEQPICKMFLCNHNFSSSHTRTWFQVFLLISFSHNFDPSPLNHRYFSPPYIWTEPAFYSAYNSTRFAIKPGVKFFKSAKILLKLPVSCTFKCGLGPRKKMID
jgi:hypothetical protein